MTKYNGTNQYEPRLLSQISQYNYSSDNSSLSNISRELTDTDTRLATKIPDDFFVSTNSNNGLVYNIRNKLWYPSTSQSSQYQHTTTRQIIKSSQQPRSSKDQFNSEIVTRSSRSSTYFPIKLTTTRGIERSRSYRRQENSEKYSTPGKIFSERVVLSGDIQVITQKTSAIVRSINTIESRQAERWLFSI